MSKTDEISINSAGSVFFSLGDLIYGRFDKKDEKMETKSDCGEEDEEVNEFLLLLSRAN